MEESDWKKGNLLFLCLEAFKPRLMAKAKVVVAVEQIGPNIFPGLLFYDPPLFGRRRRAKS